MKAPTKTRARTTPQPVTQVDLYDALTLEVERVDALLEHLAARMSDLSDKDGSQELYALSLIAEGIREKHGLIRDKAKALLAAGRGAK